MKSTNSHACEAWELLLKFFFSQRADLPTMAESGVPGYEVVGWQGLFAVAGTPPEIVARLQAEVGKALRLPEARERLAALGAEPVGSTPEEFGAFLRAEMTRWGRIIREKGIRSE